MMLSDRLSGKIALVTGIGSGIGQACALMFARHGAKVMGCDIDAVTAQQTLTQAREKGLQDIESLHPCDLTVPEQAQQLVESAIERFGGIDILLNSAAWTAMVPIQEMDFEQHWKKTIAGELDLVFLACKAAWPHLAKSGRASIINLASANAYRVLEGSPALAHCAGKGGVVAMTRQLAMEGAPHGIRANSISPGMVETGGTRGLLEAPGFRDMITSKHMIKRLGQPDDVAWCATFLAADESSWITATDFAVDGGMTKW